MDVRIRAAVYGVVAVLRSAIALSYQNQLVAVSPVPKSYLSSLDLIHRDESGAAVLKLRVAADAQGSSALFGFRSIQTVCTEASRVGDQQELLGIKKHFIYRQINKNIFGINK